MRAWLFAFPTLIDSKLIVTTWGFDQAAATGYEFDRALDMVENGARRCQIDQCDHTVGWGGSPDENGESIVEAMIMNGDDMDVGGVIGLRRIKDAVGVARKVLDHTKHTLLAGDLATEFAKQMGFTEENLSSDFSKQSHQTWLNNNCQPNYWNQNVYPDPTQSCGPYSPTQSIRNRYFNSHKLRFLDQTFQNSRKKFQVNKFNHDTIGVIALDDQKSIAAACSTNGMTHKIPGRVADSPIPGAGAYALSKVGACAATGDGDILMRFSPSFACVVNMEEKDSPSLAAEKALKKIKKYFPDFGGGIVALNAQGEYGAACHGFDKFPFSVQNDEMEAVKILEVECT